MPEICRFFGIIVRMFAEPSVQHHRVIQFEIVAPYTLRVVFADGKEQTINFRPVLAGELLGPYQLNPCTKSKNISPPPTGAPASG